MFSSILIGFIIGRNETFFTNYGQKKSVDRLSQLIRYLDKDYVDKIDTDISALYAECSVHTIPKRTIG